MILNFIFRKFLELRYWKNNFPVNPFKILENLEKSQFWSRNEIEAMQLHRLNRLIDDANKNTKYYKLKLINKNIKYASLKEFKENFPLLLKDDIIKNSDKLLNNDLNQVFIHSTSGSTGKPMSIKISGIAESYRKASRLRFEQWWGIESKDRSVLIWGFKKQLNTSGSVIQRIKTGMKNRLDINVFDLNENSIHNYFNKIQKFRPSYIRGYKSGIYMLALLMEKHSLKFEESILKVVIVTSEILFENEKKFIESVLNCKVANEYGSAESGLYAFECPAGSMHLNEESLFISTNENNEAIVTELFNNGMPLINYKNNDKIQLSNKLCSCGRTSRIVIKIEGRSSDYIACPDGTFKSQYVFYYIFKELDDIGYAGSVTQFKILQSKYSFFVDIIKGVKYDNFVVSYIETRMKEEIGENIEIIIREVAEFKREKSGKLRFFKRESFNIKQPKNNI